MRVTIDLSKETPAFRRQAQPLVAALRKELRRISKSLYHDGSPFHVDAIKDFYGQLAELKRTQEVR